MYEEKKNLLLEMIAFATGWASAQKNMIFFIFLIANAFGE
jgi:hypothetical protein